MYLSTNYIKLFKQHKYKLFKHTNKKAEIVRMDEKNYDPAIFCLQEINLDPNIHIDRK